jgi:hypothetical protein
LESAGEGIQGLKKGKMQDRDIFASQRSLHLTYVISAIASVILALLFLMGGILMMQLCIRGGQISRGLEIFGENWLVVIFQIVSGLDHQAMARLSQVNLLDISILFLSGITFFGLYLSLKRTSRVWSLVTLALPFLGIVVFLLTKTAGRSAFMAGILVISLVMFRSRLYSKVIASIGLASSILLFLGDFTASGPQPGLLVVLFVLGYILVIIWFLLIRRRFFLINTADT